MTSIDRAMATEKKLRQTMATLTKLVCLGVVSLAPLNGCKTTTAADTSGVQSIDGQTVSANDPVAASTVGIIWDNNNNNTAGCSGTLIAPNMVLTAAHCLDPAVADVVKNMKITFGLSRTAPIAAIDIASYVVHPDYRNSLIRQGIFSNADIAVITLKQSAPRGFKPVSILSTADSLQKGDAIIGAGFGVTVWDDKSTAGTLHDYQQHIFSDPDKSQPEIDYLAINHSADQPDSAISCYGDSGGPVYIMRGGLLRVAAVTSGGTGYRCLNGRALATDIRYLAPWVQKAVAGTLPAAEGFVFPGQLK